MDVENFPDYTSALPIYIAEGKAEYRGSRKGERKVKTILNWLPGKKKVKQLRARLGGLRTVCTVAGPSARQACTRCCTSNKRREPAERKQTSSQSKGVLTFRSTLDAWPPSDTFLVFSLQTVAMITFTERSNGLWKPLPWFCFFFPVS